MSKKYERTTQCYINGEWLSTKTVKPLLNPYDQSEIAQIAQADEALVQQSIDAAVFAFAKWKKTNVYKRAQLLQDVAGKMVEHREHLAWIMSLESGKKINDARAEVDLSVQNFLWNAEEIKRLNTEIIPSRSASTQLVVQEAVGVVGLITPWNFPLNLVTRKLAPALAAGCTIVLKPSSETPLIAIELVKLIAELPLPNGTINVVTGNSSMISEALMQRPEVRKISFTGSTRVGKQLYAQSAETLKKLSLELGGNAPYIVFSDADIEEAARLLVAAKKRNMGQVCTAPNRIFVQAGAKEAFIDALKREVSGLQMGNPLDEKTDVGPLINLKAVAHIDRLVEDALSKGAILRHGKADYSDVPESICPMTIIDQVNASMDIYHDEIFGPVFSIQAFETEDAVLSKANETEYGLASYVFTKDAKRIQRFASSLEFGLVGINEIVVSTNETPFGGIKYSGFGRENGVYGIKEYLEYKFINIGEDA